MTEWGYKLETYKTTLHLIETFIQSAVWPLVALIVIFGIRWLLWNQIKDLVNKIKCAKSIIIKDFTINWEDVPEVPIDNVGATDAELLLNYCASLDQSIDSFRQSIITLQNQGFLEEVKDINNNDKFLESIFNTGEKLRLYLEIYKKVKNWEKKAKDNPTSIDTVILKKVSAAVISLISIVNWAERVMHQGVIERIQID